MLTWLTGDTELKDYAQSIVCGDAFQFADDELRQFVSFAYESGPDMSLVAPFLARFAVHTSLAELRRRVSLPDLSLVQWDTVRSVLLASGR